MRYPNTKHKVDYIPGYMYSEYQLMYRTDMTSSRDKIYKLEDMYEKTSEDTSYYNRMTDAVYESKPFLFSSTEPIDHNTWLSRRQTSDVIITRASIDRDGNDEERFTRPILQYIRKGMPVFPKRLLWERNVILMNYKEVDKAIKIVENRLKGV